jgi:hypothetical protein
MIKEDDPHWSEVSQLKYAVLERNIKQIHLGLMVIAEPRIRYKPEQSNEERLNTVIEQSISASKELLNLLYNITGGKYGRPQPTV